MLHRLRYAFDHPAFKEFIGNNETDGGVEMDEAYFGGKVRNMHSSKRKALKNSTSPLIKTAVFGMIERGGVVKAQVVPDVKRETILPIVAGNITKGSVIHTDSSHIYIPLKSAFVHGVINHERGQCVDGFCHTNTIEGFWSHLKRGVYGIYHHVSPKHLQSYVDEFSLRYNTRACDTCLRFDIVLAYVSG